MSVSWHLEMMFGGKNRNSTCSRSMAGCAEQLSMNRNHSEKPLFDKIECLSEYIFVDVRFIDWSPRKLRKDDDCLITKLRYGESLLFSDWSTGQPSNYIILEFTPYGRFAIERLDCISFTSSISPTNRSNSEPRSERLFQKKH